MKKKLILVAALPASGKNYVCERICASLPAVSYFDKDRLAPLLLRGFALAGEEPNLDGRFYLENLRAAEYETLLSLALDALRFSPRVLVNAPFLAEVQSEAFMRQLKARTNALGAALVLIWVQASAAVRYERMKKRAAARDAGKLSDFESYARRAEQAPPEALAAAGAVDQWFLFDNEDEERAEKSLEKALLLLGKEI